jgi:hypothetical protein
MTPLWTPNPADGCWHPMVDAETLTEDLTGRFGCKGETGIVPLFEGLGRCSGNERDTVEDEWRTGSLILAAKDAAARSDSRNAMGGREVLCLDQRYSAIWHAAAPIKTAFSPVFGGELHAYVGSCNRNKG